MRVFILCTGRSGSYSVIRACRYINNYSVGHESLAHEFGEQRFNFEDNHIEADNRLSWELGNLERRFGDRPFYVHLIRDRDEVANSFMRRYFLKGSIIDSFCEGIRMTPPEKMSKKARLQACYDYYDTVNTNINEFLQGKSKVIKLRLENIQSDFVTFWKAIGAEGELGEALKTFKRRHNSSAARKLNLGYRFNLLLKREWLNLKMYLE